MPDAPEETRSETEDQAANSSDAASAESPSSDVNTRAAQIGLQIKRARIGAGKTRKECAEFIGVSSGAIARFEDGQAEPSLAEIEALAYFLRVHIGALLSAGEADEKREANLNVVTLMRLRRAIIGARLKQARTGRGEEIAAAASELGLTPALLRAYELGTRAIPISTLEQLLSRYGLSIENMLDMGVGAFGEAQLALQQREAFAQLPADLRALIADREALPFLRVAQSLSKLSAAELRAIRVALDALTT